MTGNAAAFHQNFNSDKKTTDIVEKDVRKWVESVVEFKAKLDKQKGELPLEKHLKKNKKSKNKKKPGLMNVTIGATKTQISSKIVLKRKRNENNRTDEVTLIPFKKFKFHISSGPNKNVKSKNSVKKSINQPLVEKQTAKEQPQTADAFDAIKESYRNIKLPPNWTSGLSNNRIIFNRVKITIHNAQQKMAVDRSLVVTKDRNLHVLINGSEISLGSWDMQKVETVEDLRRAVKDIDSLKLCEGPPSGIKSAQCSVLIFNKLKVCEACKSETTNSPKTTKKKARAKKTEATKIVAKQNSFQN